MLVEKAREKWDKKHDLNCAECIMYAANEEYNLNLSKETLKVMSSRWHWIKVQFMVF